MPNILPACAKRSAASFAFCCLVALACLALGAAPARACDTPVFQYALFNWEPDPYYVFYFHRGGENPQDAAANKILEQASAMDSFANLLFDRVNVANKQEVAPGGLRSKIWEYHRSERLPFHVVISPQGVEIYFGRLSAAGARALLASPKRKQAAQLLCDGKQGVLVLLKCSDKAKNASAEKTVRAAIARAGDEGLNVGFLSLARSDGSEKWFVRQLLNVESDLEGLDEPMVFGMFGRGHVLEPFVGKGITVENMLDLIAFINGPCSCEIKAYNPGVDILLDWDWSSKIGEWAYEEPTDRSGLFYVEFEEPSTEAPAENVAMVSDEPQAAPAATPSPTARAKNDLSKATPATPKAGKKTPKPRRTAAPSPTAAPTATVASAEAAGKPPRERAVAALPQSKGKTPPQASGAGGEPAPRQPQAQVTWEELFALEATPAAQSPALEDDDSFVSSLSLKLGLGLGVGMVLVVIGGFVLLRRYGER